MIHLTADEAIYKMLCQAVMQAAMTQAQERGLCPSCTLLALAAFIGANVLLQRDAYEDGEFTEKAKAVFDLLTEATMYATEELGDSGTFWEPGDDPVVRVH